MNDPPNTKTQKEPRATRYLKLVFSKNPMWESSQILEMRRKAFRLERAVAMPKPQSVAQSQMMREAMKRAVDTIQHQFWTMPQEELKRRVHAIDTQKAPHLTGAIKRLRTAASCRAEFPKLATASGMHLELFQAFKTAVVLPPQEAGYVREQFFRSIENRKELKNIKHAIGIIRKDYPVLYALERDWFKSILDTKKPLREVRASQPMFEDFDFSFIGILFSWPSWIIISIVIRILIRSF